MHAVRFLRRSPGFTVVAVTTLALGIGATTAIFSVVRGVLLRPLPYQDPDRLVVVWHRFDGMAQERGRLSGPDFVDYQRDADLFEGLAAASALGTNLTSGDGPPEQVTLSWVSSNFFDLLGAPPQWGRGFVPEDRLDLDLSVVTRPGYVPPAGAVVISDGIWRRRFGGDPGVLGQTIELNSQRMKVIGVAPAGFRLYLPAGAIMPTVIDAWTLPPVDLATLPRGPGGLTVVGRLKPGVTHDQARQQLQGLSQRLREGHAAHARLGTEADLAPMHREVVAHVEPTLLALLGSVGFVLLIACANVANLSLVRGASRQRELAIRAALGGSRARIALQLLHESGIVGLLGGMAGVVLAYWGLRLLLALGPENLPRVEAVGMDGSLLVFTLAISLGATLLFGTAPAWHSAGTTNLSARLGERGGDGRGAGSRLRRGVVVSEVALSLVLLLGAGLLLRSFVALNRVQPGFDPTNVVTMNVSLPFFDYRDAGKRSDLFSRLIQRVQELPGVDAAGGISPLPLADAPGADFAGPYALDPGDEDAWARNEADYRPVTPGYFETMRIELLRGRLFTSADNGTDAPLVVTVDRVLADRIWPGRDPVGEQLVITVPNPSATGSLRAGARVVGVVEHVRHAALTRDGVGTIYVPYRHHAWFEHTLVVRTELSRAVVLDAVRREIGALDPQLPVFAVRPLRDYVDDALAPTRFAAALIGLFAGVALALATVGLYGVVSYDVRQRTREFGVRMALGAAPITIVHLVVRGGIALAAFGVGVGLLGAALLTRLLASLLFGVTLMDPLTYALVSLLLILVAAAASWLPAWRATRVDLLTALRD